MGIKEKLNSMCALVDNMQDNDIFEMSSLLSESKELTRLIDVIMTDILDQAV